MTDRSKNLVRAFAKIVGKQTTPIHDYHSDYRADDIVSSGLPWLKLDIEIPVNEIVREIKSVEQFLVEHRTQYNNNAGWKSFCIHGKSFDTTQEVDDDRPFVWTPEAMEHMPETVKFFRTTWPAEEYRRLRVMKLEPGASIEIHRDRERSGLAEINIAITQPLGCNFYMEGHGIIPFQSGQAFMIDTSNNHAVLNDSDEDRYHIIVHQHCSPEFEELVELSYHKQYNINI